jgi:hypothetical protein
MKTITINDNIFTPKNKMVETLFKPIQGKTASGFYKIKNDGILFFRPSGEHWFFLVANRHDERFFVTCGENNGKPFFMHSLCCTEEKQLGFDKIKYSDREKLAREIWKNNSKSK